MSDCLLPPVSPLGFALDESRSSSSLLVLANTTLEECHGHVIVSLACAAGHLSSLKRRLNDTFGLHWPPVGEQRTSTDGQWRLFGLQEDQRWIIGTSWQAHRPADIIEQFDDIARCTDQSDGWVMLRLSGEHSVAILERSCALDLAGGRFPSQGAVRTRMEHQPAVVARDGDNAFLLLAPRSFAHGFRHMLETSIRYLVLTGR